MLKMALSEKGIPLDGHYAVAFDSHLQQPPTPVRSIAAAHTHPHNDTNQASSRQIETVPSAPPLAEPSDASASIATLTGVSHTCCFLCGSSSKPSSNGPHCSLSIYPFIHLTTLPKRAGKFEPKVQIPFYRQNGFDMLESGFQFDRHHHLYKLQ